MRLIPAGSGLPRGALTRREQPSRTYHMRREAGAEAIRGYTDGREAVAQSMYKILHTPRYRHAIYSWDYGMEYEDLLGKNVAYVYPELKRRIREALLWDSRIRAVEDFQFSSEKNKVRVRFTARTAHGDISGEMEAEI